MDKQIAVLTGDIINSSYLDADKLIYGIKELENYLRESKQINILGVDFFRGDSWQLILKDISMSLRTAIIIRAFLKSRFDMDTRISIAIGNYAKIEQERVSMSTGEVFVLSGRRLDEMRHSNNLSFKCQNPNIVCGNWIEMCIRLCDVIISDWTQKQASLILSMLGSASAIKGTELAIIHKITSQTVNKTLIRAKWKFVEQVLILFEDEFKGL